MTGEKDPDNSVDEALERAIDAGHLEDVDREIPGVEELFEVYQKLDSWIGLSQNPLDADAEISEQEMPSEIGHYQLREKLGSGSFGTVYLAYDRKLDRSVAIKIPRYLLPGDHGKKQFLREARAAAQLNHPHIVSVHEVGEEKGLVYIVSDFIEGESLDQWHKGEPLDPRKAASLCITIAEAMDHAHQAGIVHRDIKPSNIMMDNNGNPHVMDFGLAKRELADASLSIEGRIVGTPAYMSPEQARGDSHQVDSRTDVYGLGMILFELLTGERPFRGSSQMLLHQVLHEDAPSLRKLNHSIPRDLETIALKCLQKAPSRRYESATGLSTDLERWLQGKPIAARPVGQIERSWQWCKRKPALAGLMGVTMAALLVLIIGGNIYNRQLKNERDRATEEARLASIATHAAERAKAEGDKSRAQAEENFDLAQQTVDEFFTAVSESVLLGQPKMEPLRRQFLEKARKYYEEFIRQQPDNLTTQNKLAEAHFRLANIHGFSGDYLMAKSELEKAIKLWTQLSLNAPGYSYIGVFGSEESQDPIVTEVNEGSPASKAGIQLGDVIIQFDNKKIDTFEALQLAILARRPRERVKLIVQRNDEKVELQVEIAELGVSDYVLAKVVAFNNLGYVFYKQGKQEEAIELYQKAINILKPLAIAYRDLPSYGYAYASRLASSYTHIGIALSGLGNHEEANEQFLKAIELLEPIAGTNFRSAVRMSVHPSARLAEAYNSFGNGLSKLGKEKEAIENFLKAIETLEELANDQSGGFYPVPTDRQSRNDHTEHLAGAYHSLGLALARLGKQKEAIEQYLKAIIILKPLAIDHPYLLIYTSGLAKIYFDLGGARHHLGKMEGAIEAYEKAVVLRKRLFEEHQNVVVYASDLATTYHYLAVGFSRLGKQEEAIKQFRKALEIRNLLVKDHQGVVLYVSELATTHYLLGTALAMLGKQKEAIAQHRKAIEIRELLVNNHSDVLAYRSSLIDSYNLLGYYLTTVGKYEEAIRECNKAIPIIKKLSKDHLDVPDYLLTLSVSYHFHGVASAKHGDHAAASEDGEAIAQLKVPDNLPDARTANLYNAACLISLASGAAAKDEDVAEADRKVLIDKYAIRAVALLNEDRSLGYFKTPEMIAHMKKDPYLDPLRDRDDFKQLLKELEEEQGE